MKITVTFGDNDFYGVFSILKDLIDDYVIAEAYPTEDEMRTRVLELLDIAINLDGRLEYKDYIKDGTEISFNKRKSVRSVHLEIDFYGQSNLYVR